MPTIGDIEGTVRKLIAGFSKGSEEDISLKTPLQEIGLCDSDILQLEMQTEDMFHLAGKISHEETASIVTGDDLIDLVTKVFLYEPKPTPSA